MAEPRSENRRIKNADTCTFLCKDSLHIIRSICGHMKCLHMDFSFHGKILWADARDGHRKATFKAHLSNGVEKLWVKIKTGGYAKNVCVVK